LILSCHTGYPFQPFQIIFASMAARKVLQQNPSLPAPHKVVMVKNQIGFKLSARVHPSLLSFRPLFRLDAGLCRSTGRRSPPPPEDVMDVQRLKKAGAPGRRQRRRRQTTRKKEEPATFSSQRNDTPSLRKNREAGRENRNNEGSKTNLRR